VNWRHTRNDRRERGKTAGSGATPDGRLEKVGVAVGPSNRTPVGAARKTAPKRGNGKNLGRDGS
jgi:hypothetical protein